MSPQYVIGKVDEGLGIFILNTQGPIPEAPIFETFGDAQDYIKDKLKDKDKFKNKAKDITIVMLLLLLMCCVCALLQNEKLFGVWMMYHTVAQSAWCRCPAGAML